MKKPRMESEFGFSGKTNQQNGKISEVWEGSNLKRHPQPCTAKECRAQLVSPKLQRFGLCNLIFTHPEELHSQFPNKETLMATAWKEGKVNLRKSGNTALLVSGQRLLLGRLSMHRDESHNIYAALHQVWDFSCTLRVAPVGFSTAWV